MYRNKKKKKKPREGRAKVLFLFIKWRCHRRRDVDLKLSICGLSATYYASHSHFVLNEIHSSAY